MTASLAARIEAAECGSRALSDEVLRACGFKRVDLASGGGVVWCGLERTYDDGHQPSPTESIEDASALLPSDCYEYGFSGSGPKRPTPEPSYYAWIKTQRSDEFEPYAAFEGCAATPALALSAALVRAQEHDDGNR